MPALTKKFLRLAVVSFVVLSAVYVLVPELRKPLVREDNLLEMLTAVLFLWVAIAATKWLLGRGRQHPVDWAIPALATLGFLEEVSFGRLFFAEIPIVEGVKIDALHDYLRVLLKLLESDGRAPLVAGVAAAVAAVLIAGLYRYHDVIAVQLRRESFRFTVLCLGFVALASVIDLDFVTHYYMPFVEEFTEALAALSLLYGYWCLRDEDAAASAAALQRPRIAD